ncbi:MAG: hypothetical protein LBV16_07150 [Elusimicrobiota bacterium]|nr:hypothetical protein [Elusimicrobiota bacterium]
MFIWTFRIFIAVFSAGAAYFFIENSVLALILGFIAGAAFVFVEYLCEKISLSAFLFAAFGIALGSVLGLLSNKFGVFFAAMPLSALNINYLLIVYILFALLIIVVFARSVYIGKYDRNEIKRQPILKSAGNKNSYEELLADMSVLEDGRILDFVKQEFPPVKIIITDFVLEELKKDSEAEEQMKKYRARRGLETVSKLKEAGYVIDKPYDKSAISAKDLPSKIIELAGLLNVRLITISFVAAKNASLKKVKVLNLKVLSETLSPICVPGDVVNIYLASEGSHQNQAIGFLNDGTKVIVADGKRYMNKVVRLIITAVVKNTVGKNVFGKVIENNREHFHRNNNHKKEESNQ